MYDIDWTAKAAKQLRKIAEQQARERIHDEVETLRNWPVCRNIKALSGHKYGYRLRVGGYRVFFDIGTAIRIIKIQEVKKRNEHTY